MKTSVILQKGRLASSIGWFKGTPITVFHFSFMDQTINGLFVILKFQILKLVFEIVWEK